jgi:hypothetical protein
MTQALYAHMNNKTIKKKDRASKIQGLRMQHSGRTLAHPA